MKRLGEQITGQMEQPQTSLTRFLVLGTLETLVNQALAHEPRARERLRTLHGTAIRVRTERPMAIVYVLIYEDGIEILPEFEGYVHIRIRGSLGAIMQWLLSPNAPLPEEDQVRILGPDDRITLATDIISEFSLWSVVRNWLDDHVRLNDLLGLLRREDPRWLAKLQGLPEQVGELANELGRQRLIQEDILNELRGLKSGLRRERRMDAACLTLGLLLLLGALATLGDLLPVAASISMASQAVLLGSIGLTLLLSRLLFGHRY